MKRKATFDSTPLERNRPRMKTVPCLVISTSNDESENVKEVAERREVLRKRVFFRKMGS